MIVADGMGGHAAGDIASRMAISALIDLALDIPDWSFRADETHVPEMQRRMLFACSTSKTGISCCSVATA